MILCVYIYIWIQLVKIQPSPKQIMKQVKFRDILGLDDYGLIFAAEYDPTEKCHFGISMG